MRLKPREENSSKLLIQEKRDDTRINSILLRNYPVKISWLYAYNLIPFQKPGSWKEIEEIKDVEPG